MSGGVIGSPNVKGQPPEFVDGKRARPLAATARNMPASRYGVVPVSAFGFPDGEDADARSFSYWASAIDLLAQGMEPRPLYSERRRMEQLSPARLGLFLITWTLYHRLPDRIARTRLVGRLWRMGR